MLLRAGEKICFFGLADRKAAGEPRTRRKSQWICVKANFASFESSADSARVLSTVAERYGDGAVGMARYDPGRQPGFNFSQSKSNHGHMVTAVFAAVSISAQFDA